MRTSLLPILVDPVTKQPLALTVGAESHGDATEGMLASGDCTYTISSGVPRFVAHVADVDQRQTQESFGYKWRRQDTYTSAAMTSALTEWMVHRYGFQDAESMRKYFGGRRRVLDAGCGGGMTAANWMNDRWRERPDAEWFGVDISEAVDVAKERLGGYAGTSFIQADVLNLPFASGSFDTVFSEGVLHHTPSTRAALASVASVLAPGGELLFYVYRKKGPMREFADGLIRQHVAGMSPAEAWEALRPLTALGKALTELHAEVDVPSDIEYLGIKAGRQDVQRLVYWNFLKLFWNEAFSFDENNHVNFDWYHPKYAHTQTEGDVRQWCAELGLSITHFDAQDAGFTVRAVKETHSR